MRGCRIYAIGHSTKEIADFIDSIKSHSIDLLVDVRTIPRSKHNPQFNKDALETALKASGIGYVHIAGLGGLRSPNPNSKNSAWRNASFRGYADYMQTAEFEEALNELISVSKRHTLAIMCAEGNPFRCHRSLIADALTVRGVEVVHISGPGKGRTHRITPFAKVIDTLVTYPAE